MATWRKPVSQITDRAKRYRANRIRPAGPKRCAYRHRGNSCKGPLGINHKDGNESNSKKRNLNWACKRHNAQLAIYHKRRGKGVRTRQYNPGAGNLAQYVQAAVEHTRGAHDAGGKVIHETPKSKRRAFAREIAFRKTGRFSNPMHERTESKKLSHSAVDYEHPSHHGNKRCLECAHFIPASPPRCEAVAGPIRAEDYCVRFERETIKPPELVRIALEAFPPEKYQVRRLA